MKKILIIEDEIKLNDIISDYLKDAGYSVSCAYNGEEALSKFYDEEFHAVVLDIMIPVIDGWSVCRKIRKDSGVPIIILTARSDEDDKLMGFELGADEYVTKPFSPRVLVARVTRLMNRITETEVKLGSIKYKDIYMDLDIRKVSIANEEIEFAPKEFDLLKYLIANKNMVLSREMILNKVWGYDFYGELRVVDSHIKKIRKKMGSSNYIKTVVKIGYRMD